MKRYLSIDELSQLFGVSRAWIYNHKEVPRVTCRGKVLRPLRFDLEEVEKVFESTQCSLKSEYEKRGYKQMGKENLWP